LPVAVTSDLRWDGIISDGHHQRAEAVWGAKICGISCS
jgi:hypothetical protein